MKRAEGGYREQGAGLLVLRASCGVFGIQNLDLSTQYEGQPDNSSIAASHGERSEGWQSPVGVRRS